MSSIFVAFLLGRERTGWPSPELFDFAMELAKIQERGTRRIVLHQVFNQTPHDSARNFAVQQFLPSGCEWLLMLDNDMTAYVDLLDLLDTAPAEADVVAPRFFGIVDRSNCPSPSFHLGLSRDQVDPAATGEWVELKGTGSAVIAIRRRVFEKIELPAFRFIYDPRGVKIQGEDFYFCEKVRAAGLRIFGSNRVECGHMHNVNLSVIARGMGAAGPVGGHFGSFAASRRGEFAPAPNQR